MTTQTEALKLALEALEYYDKPLKEYSAKTARDKDFKAIAAIKEALAQPEQEPVAIVIEVNKVGAVALRMSADVTVGTRLYTTPPQRKPLTDEQIDFLNFLYGAGEWDGAWFEGKHPTKKGAFWWRKDMKRLFDYGIKE